MALYEIGIKYVTAGSTQPRMPLYCIKEEGKKVTSKVCRVRDQWRFTKWEMAQQKLAHASQTRSVCETCINI